MLRIEYITLLTANKQALSWTTVLCRPDIILAIILAQKQWKVCFANRLRSVFLLGLQSVIIKMLLFLSQFVVSCQGCTLYTFCSQPFHLDKYILLIVINDTCTQSLWVTDCAWGGPVLP